MSKKVIKRLIETNNHPLYGRDLARLFKKNQKTVQASLQRLEEKGVLVKEIVGRNYLYTIQSNSKSVIYDLVSAEVDATKEFLESNFEIKELVADLRKITDEPILIFGSYVKGHKTKDSDVDILILDTKKLDIGKIQHKYTRRIHLVPMSKSEFKKGTQSLYYDVLQHHIIIQGYAFFMKRWLEQHG